MDKPPPPPPIPSAESASATLPYAVAAVSVAVLVGVAALVFAQPRRPRMAVDEVIVLDAPSPSQESVPKTRESVPTAPSATPESVPKTPESVPTAREPAPGDVLEAVLTDEGSSGDGSVDVGGVRVYVRGGRRGERARFRILEVKTSRKGNRYATAELASAGEVQP